MKRITSFVLIGCMLLCLFPVLSNADEDRCGNMEMVEYLSDGSYFVTEIERIETLDKGTVSFLKQLHYYNSSDDLQWTMKLNAAFTYNGTTAACTSCSVTYTIQNTAWHYDSKQETIDGNVATGTLTMVKKLLGIPIKTVTRTLTITCDKDGNVS